MEFSILHCISERLFVLYAPVIRDAAVVIEIKFMCF